MKRRILGSEGDWPPDMERVVDWECGRCGARKSEIIAEGAGCPEKSAPCPMWPVYGKKR